jgi:hypothetical protein
LHEPIEHVDVETHVENLKEDNNIVTLKSKRQKTAKSFGEDYIIYLMDDTSKTIEETYSSLDADLRKAVVQSEMDSICLMELGRLLIVLTGVNLWDVNGCSTKSLGLIVLLRRTRRGLWLRVIPRKKVKIILILIHQLPV